MSERDDDMGRVLGLLEQVRDGIWDAVQALQEANVIQDERDKRDGRQTVQDEASGVAEGSEVESSGRMSDERLSELREVFGPEGHGGSRSRELFAALEAERLHARTLKEYRAAPTLTTVTYRDNHHCGSGEHDDDGEPKTVQLRRLAPERTAIMGEILSILEGFGSKEVNNTWKSGQPYITLADELIAILDGVTVVEVDPPCQIRYAADGMPYKQVTLPTKYRPHWETLHHVFEVLDSLKSITREPGRTLADDLIAILNERK